MYRVTLFERRESPTITLCACLLVLSTSICCLMTAKNTEMRAERLPYLLWASSTEMILYIQVQTFILFSVNTHL